MYQLRPDQEFIVDVTPSGARVLEVGCNQGNLLAELERRKNIRGRGLELRTEGVKACIAKGIPVIQGDADADLASYPDGAFDLAVLSRTLQELRKPQEVLEHLLRIAKRVAISIPNFGHWRCRSRLLWGGRLPSGVLSQESWYATTSIHPCTLRDFVDYCATYGITIEKSVAFSQSGRKLSSPGRLSNFFAIHAVFLLKK